MAWATSVLKHRERGRCRIAGKYRETGRRGGLPDPFVLRDSCKISTKQYFFIREFYRDCGALALSYVKFNNAAAQNASQTRRGLSFALKKEGKRFARYTLPSQNALVVSVIFQIPRHYAPPLMLSLDATQ